MTTTTTTMMMTITMTTDPSIGSWWGPRIIGASTALLIVVSACSSTSVDVPATTSTLSPAVTTTDGGDTNGATATTNASPPGPTTVLAEALSQYASSYLFTGVATVNGAVATVVSGRWLETGSQMTISSGEGEVEYIITPEGEWARLPGGVWEELEGDLPTGNPLAALATPESLSLVETTGSKVVLRAVYPAATLDLEGDLVEVQLVFERGSLTEASYRIEIEGNTAQSVTTFAELVDTSPITNPRN
jgi:hypothetical protein